MQVQVFSHTFLSVCVVGRGALENSGVMAIETSLVPEGRTLVKLFLFYTTVIYFFYFVRKERGGGMQVLPSWGVGVEEQ